MDNNNNENNQPLQQPETTPEVTSEVTPETTPEATPEVTSEVTPEAVTPVTPQPDVKEKKSLSNGAIAGIIGGGVVVLAAIICAIIFIPKLFKSDKKVVLDAFVNTFAESDDSYIEETLGLSELTDKMEEKGYNQTLDLTLNSVLGAEEVSGLGVSLDMNSDPTSKKASGGYIVTYNGTDLLSADYFTDNETLYVGVEDLIDGYLTLPCKDGLTALADSYVGESLDMSGISGDIDFFPDDTADEDAAVNGDVVASIENIWDNTTFKKVGSEKIDVNGETVSAKAYTVTIAEEDLENAIIDMYEAAATSAVSYESYELEDGDSDSVDDSIEQVKQMIPSIITGDFVLNVYIADDKVVKMTSSADTNIMGVKVSYDFYVDINDDLSGALEIGAAGESVSISGDIKGFKESPNGDIKLTVSDEDVVVLNITSDNSTTESSKNIVSKISCQYDGEDVGTLSINWTSDREAQSFGGVFSVDVSETTAEISLDGKFVDVTKGESYGVQIDNLALTVDDTEVFTMSVNSNVNTSPQLTELDSSLPTYDLSTMTESDLEGLVDTDSEKYTSWLQKLEDSGIADLFTNLTTSSAVIVDDTDDEDVEDDADDYEEYEDSDSDDDEMTNILTSYDDSVNVEILGTINNLEMSYGCEYFVDFDDENYDLSIEYSLEEDTTADKLLSSYSYYDEDSVTDSEYSQTITISDGTEIGYDRLTTEYDGDPCARYYMVRDLGDGYFLTLDVVDYTNSISAEEAAEALSEQYFKVQ